MFIDTHCHLFLEYYDDIDGILDKIKAAGISKVINNGTGKDSNIEVLDSIAKYDFVYGAIGIHPEEVDNYSDEDIDFIIQHLNDKKVVAIGEIGLDYHYGKENRDKQIELFEKQLEIAEKYNKPVIIHSRDATLDTIECLKKYKVRGTMHSFSGSYETAMIYIKMGLMLGINGVVTFKNCNLIDVVKKVGINNIVLETDSPYLTPTPFRGQRNDSSHIIDIAKFLSDNCNLSMDEISEITNNNVKRTFDI